MDRESREMLLETAHRFLRDKCGKEVVNGVEKGLWPAELWAGIEELGLTLVAVPEEQGGVGGALEDMLALARVAGAHAVPVPLAETALAGMLVAHAGGKPAGGPSTLALGALTLKDGRLSGKVERVPFASSAQRFVAVIDDGAVSKVVVVDAARAAVVAAPSHAGEPYGSVRFDAAECAFMGASPVSAARAFELAALTRTMQMAGAAETVLSTAVTYCQERVQFGRAISTFQAIQHLLAELASYVAATIASAEAAARDAQEGGIADGGSFSIAAAKSQASEFAHRIAAISHQCMGAMGFTHEHTLHHYTRRLWVWRRDFGSETFWAEKIGTAYAAAGPDALWTSLTASRYAA